MFKVIATLLITVSLVACCGDYSSALPKPPLGPSLPDFSQYENTQAKKQAFFDYLLPLIEKSADRVQQQRQQLLALQAAWQAEGELSSQQLAQLKVLAEEYGLEIPETEEGATPQGIDEGMAALLKRVDTLPPSLILAQAANESAWGTSRFATQANNLFGQWCFTQGCGLVPARRGARETHEVRKFKSPQRAVGAYFNNINSSRAYAQLRQLRAQARADNRPLLGTDLAAGLSKYSSRGQAYIKEIRAMIRYNQLERYDVGEKVEGKAG